MKPDNPPSAEAKAVMLTYDERTQKIVPVFPEDRRRYVEVPRPQLQRQTMATAGR
jgi:hypothetical protein